MRGPRRETTQGKPMEHDAVFVERVADWIDYVRLPHMAGRVVGYLLLAEPAHQSAAQLSDALQASSGSISMSVRLLVDRSLAEPVRFPGDRKTYYRLREDFWSQILRDQSRAVTDLQRLATDVSGMSLAEEGRTEPLRDLEPFANFWGSKVPELVEEWEQADARSPKGS